MLNGELLFLFMILRRHALIAMACNHQSWVMSHHMIMFPIGCWHVQEQLHLWSGRESSYRYKLYIQEVFQVGSGMQQQVRGSL